MTIKENNVEKEVPGKSKTKKKVNIKKYDDLEGKFLLVKVGTKEDPASQEDINEVQNALVNLLEVNDVNCLALVSGHDIDMKVVDKPPES
tara:strand:- start:4768 stop:5037 length:270 start_codon:yes stop_codon:yes gene_type:complete